MSRSRSHQSAAEKPVADDADVICKVTAAKVGFNIKGQLSIQRVNDTLYMADFQGPFADNVHVDLDCMEFLPDSHVVNLIGEDGKTVSYKVLDPLEFDVLMEAKSECESICDLKLRLNSLLRDVYFSGLYSTLKTDHKMKVKEEVEKLRIEAPNLFFSTMPDRADSATEIEKERHAVESAASKAVCAFCFKVRAHEKDLGFAIHPYVPKNFQGQTIYMCSTCVENWKEYRDAADHHHQLVLENEVNEEVCAVCSDTPETLVLCSGCPRSFCHTCLFKILSKKDHEALTAAEDADWQCMCCANGIDALPPMTRDSWVRIRSVNAIEAEKLKKKEAAQAQAAAGVVVASSSSSSSSSSAAAAAGTATTAAASSSSSAVAAPKDEDGSRRSTRRHEKQAEVEAPGEEVAAPVVALSTDKRGRYPRHSAAATAEMEVVEITGPVAASSSSSGNRGGRGKRKHQEEEMHEEAEEVPEGPVEEVLPPVSSEFDELFYFSQYVRYIDNATYTVLHGSKKAANEAQTCTDDSCFLCKDGGELIECDWKHPTKKKCRCLKVYHEYCLEYEVKDGVKWMCPRHFCDVCGSQSLKYVCKYCSISICANCPSELVKKYGYVNYSELEDQTGEYEGSIPIACHNCIELLNRSKSRPELLEGLHYEINLKVKKFPGVPAKKKEGVFRVVRNSSSGGGGASSSNASASTTTGITTSVVATATTAAKYETAIAENPVESQKVEAAAESGAKEEPMQVEDSLFSDDAVVGEGVPLAEAPPSAASKSVKTPKKRAGSKDLAGTTPPTSVPETETSVTTQENSDVGVSSSSSEAASAPTAPSAALAVAAPTTSSSSASSGVSTGSSARNWPEHEIQQLLEGGRVYGLDVDKMLKDPNYSHMLIFRTQAQIKAKMQKLFEGTAEKTLLDQGSKANKTVKGVLKKEVLSGNDSIPFL